jgi:uncharacterized protein (DUF4415 family)
MTAKKRSTVLASEDDAPDLSAPEWRAAIDRAPVKRGRPKASVTKVLVSLRLDPDVLDAYKADGPGWQSRINETLRRATQRQARKRA